jgi:DNA-directed RNA polymerase subunit M/transcription elongation factor TFIIS
MPKSAESQNVVFEVRSKCSNCQSVLRTYNKATKQTSCYQCGKKQPKPRIDIEKLKFEGKMPDLSYLEKKQNAQGCPACGNGTVKISNKDDVLFECAKCGKSVE